LVGVQTEAERAAETRRRAEAEGNVLEIDDDDEPAAAAAGPRAGRFRAPERRSTRFLEEPLAPEPAAPRRNSRRGEERISFRCRRVYFGTALRRDVAVVFAPSGVTIEWRSEVIGLYIEARLTPSNMTSFDMYHGPGGKCGSLFSLLYDEKRSPDAIREFFAIGLREKPRCLIDGFEPTDEEGSGKYVVVVLEGDALATFKRKVVPAVVWGGHIGWPAAPVLSTPAAARLFLEGVPIADALAAGGAPAAHSGIARKRPRRDVGRSVPSPAPAAATAHPPGWIPAGFVVPPVHQIYKRAQPPPNPPATWSPNLGYQAMLLRLPPHLCGTNIESETWWIRRSSDLASWLPDTPAWPTRD